MSEPDHLAGEGVGRRVAVVLHHPSLGGATLSVLRIVPLLAARGWEFCFWVPRPSDVYDHLAGQGHDVAGAPRYIEYGIRAWRASPGLRARAVGIPPYLRAFRAFLRERSPALLHANTITTATEAMAAVDLAPAVVVHVHEILQRGARARLLRRMAWRADEVVAVSRASGDPLLWRGRAPRIVFEAAPVPEHPALIREAPQPFAVGTVGVISTRKGSDLFVEAARRLLAESDAFSFEMVGAPDDAAERRWADAVLSQAASIGVAHRARADTFERYRSWDAFVLPSRVDPFPIAMLEAMATGVPVIGTRRDGIPEQIADGCGLLVEPDDPAGLARAIASLASRDADERRSMGRAARERVATKFNLERQADGIHRAYLSALTGA